MATDGEKFVSLIDLREEEPTHYYLRENEKLIRRHLERFFELEPSPSQVNASRVGQVTQMPRVQTTIAIHWPVTDTENSAISCEAFLSMLVGGNRAQGGSKLPAKKTSPTLSPGSLSSESA